MYRTPESNYTKYYSNHKLLQKAEITRIDLFMLKMIRNYSANIRNINNSLIFSSSYPNPRYLEKTRFSGHTPPEAFIGLDNVGLIHNTHGHPLIYHYNRKNYNKKNTIQQQLKYRRPRNEISIEAYKIRDRKRRQGKHEKILVA